MLGVVSLERIFVTAFVASLSLATWAIWKKMPVVEQVELASGVNGAFLDELFAQ